MRHIKADSSLPGTDVLMPSELKLLKKIRFLSNYFFQWLSMQALHILGFKKKNYFLPSLSIRDTVIEDKLHVCVGYWDILNQICLHFILFNFLIWFLGTKINGLCCVNLLAHRPLFHPWDKAEGQIFHFDLCTLYLDTYLLPCCEPDNKNKHACKSTCIFYSSKIKTI